MRFTHTHRKGFWLGFIDFFTAGLFFLFYASAHARQADVSLLSRTSSIWLRQAYLLGVPTLFIYPLVWMARISEELNAKAVSLGVPGPHTSWRHMFWWNMAGCLAFGPMIATHRFFNTLNGIEQKLNEAGA